MTALDDWHKEQLPPTATARFQAWKKAEQSVPRHEAQCELALRELLAELTERQKKLLAKVIDDLTDGKGLH
jgi:FixJ family two-component response regulator